MTVIDESGNVLYESLSEIGSDNHLDRPEVQTAISTGEGSSHRHSASVGYETFYYAMKADDGNIIRVSQDVKTERLFVPALASVRSVSDCGGAGVGNGVGTLSH